MLPGVQSQFTVSPASTASAAGSNRPPSSLRTRIVFGASGSGVAIAVKPIVGLEAYVTPKTHRSERKRVRWGDAGASASSSDDVSGSGAYTHMTLLSETTEGMHNLFRLGSRASLEGFFYKPRMDRELLSEYAKGLIATTGCPSGEVQTYLRLGQYDQAVASAAELCGAVQR